MKGGEEAFIRGGAYFKFRPIGGALRIACWVGGTKNGGKRGAKNSRPVGPFHYFFPDNKQLMTLSRENSEFLVIVNLLQNEAVRIDGNSWQMAITIFRDIQACYIKMKIHFIKRLSFFLILQLYCPVLHTHYVTFLSFRSEQLSSRLIQIKNE